MNRNTKSICYALYALISLIVCGVEFADAAQKAASASQNEKLREIFKTEEQFLAYAQNKNSNMKIIYNLMRFALEAGFVKGLDSLIQTNLELILSTNRVGNTIVHAAVAAGDVSIIEHLVNRYPYILAAVNQLGETPFLTAIRVGNLEAIKLLITTGRIDLTRTNLKGQHAIHIAIELGHLHMVKHLVEICGVSPNTKSCTHVTPLHVAAGYGQLGVVEYLVSKGADVRSVEASGRTPLMGAVVNGCIRTVIFLIRNGALPGRKDAQGATVLHLAAGAGKLQIVKFLIAQCKFPVDVADNGFNTALVYAANNGQIAVMEYLIEHDAKIVGVHSVQQSPLLCALSQQQTDAAVFLVRHGAQIKSQHLKVAQSSGQLQEILRGATDVLASGQIDDAPFWVYINAGALGCCTSNKDVTAQRVSAWMESEVGKTCALLTHVVPFFRKLYYRGQEEVQKLQETERILHQYVPRDVAQLILSDFLPIPRLLLNRGQERASVDVDGLESSGTIVGRKRQHNVDSQERLDLVSDDGVEGSDSERTEQPSADDVARAARVAKRQRRN